MGRGVPVFMRAWRNIFLTVTGLMILLFAAGNLFLLRKAPDDGRPYRVEINRLALQIEQEGFEHIDLSQCEYVFHVETYSDHLYDDHFFDSESDHAFRVINGSLYRFDYSVQNNMSDTQTIVIVNTVMALMSILVLGVLFYVRTKILRPFDQLTNIPYELSKGNLTAPVKENKNRFFGKFLWGIDLLRENIEQQKQRELELQKEKKTLLLSLSHDLKTPLSAIKLYAKALSKNLYHDTEKQKSIAENINKKADEIEEYVSQIITASREDFLCLDVKNEEFYLSDLVQNTILYYREKLALVKTEFIVGEYKNCLLSGDINRSIEVLQNIMENALKYGDGTRVELLFPEEETGVLISVRNSGCTLDKADLPHIFESFWRGSNAGHICGSGLGLYICRQLMHRMNGEIFAESGDGSITVTVVFGRA